MNRSILHIDEVGSTNQFLKTCYKDGIAHGKFCVHTDFQTEGKGQRGNAWESAPAENILASFLVDMRMKLADIPFLNLASTLAVTKCLESYGIEPAMVKWPNDVMVLEKKVAGILIENSIEGDKLRYGVIGIGLNVNGIHIEQKRAGSMTMFTGKKYDRNEVLGRLYDEIYFQLSRPRQRVLSEVNEKLFKQNETVIFNGAVENYPFKVLRFHKNGGLVVEQMGVEMVIEHHQWRMQV